MRRHGDGLKKESHVVERMSCRRFLCGLDPGGQLQETTKVHTQTDSMKQGLLQATTRNEEGGKQEPNALSMILWCLPYISD
jgi:hypothetical protein